VLTWRFGEVGATPSPADKAPVPLVLLLLLRAAASPLFLWLWGARARAAADGTPARGVVLQLVLPELRLWTSSNPGNHVQHACRGACSVRMSWCKVNVMRWSDTVTTALYGTGS
jgi:hypothetical protein